MIPLPMLVGCLSGAQPPAWTPADLTGIDFWLQPPPSGDTTNGGLLTLSSGKVASAADAAGSATVLAQATSGRQPTVNTGDPLDGYNTLDWVYASDTHLESATGGLSGDVAHTMHALVKLTASAPYYPAIGYGSIMCYGNPVGENAHIGVQNSAGGQWWAGGGPNHGLGVGGALDGSWHLITRRTDGTTDLLFVDGVEVYSGNTGTVPAANYIGAGRWRNDPSYGGCADHRGLDKIWVGQESTYAEMRQVAKYLADRYPTTWKPTLMGIGDSLTVGYTLADPATESWLAIVAAARGMRRKVHAITGWTTTDIANGGSGIVSLAKDGAWVAAMVTDLSGLNDLNASNTATDIWARKQTNVATLRAKGVPIIVGLTVPKAGLLSGGKETQRQALNALILAGLGTEYDYVVDIAALACFSDPTNTTYYDVDQTHWKAAAHTLAAAAIASGVP